MEKLSIDKLRTDGGTQIRAKLSDETIEAYAEAYARKTEMPPVTAFYDGEAYWLADGFHRVQAARKAGRSRLDVDVRAGTQRDAVLHACGANDSHGLRRSNADKRRAVETLLRDEKWGRESSNWIAKHCGVSQPFVSTVKAEVITVITSARVRGSDGKSYPASKPRKPAPARATESETITPEQDEAIEWYRDRDRAERDPAPTSPVARAPLSLVSSGGKVAAFDPDDALLPLVQTVARCICDWPASESMEPLLQELRGQAANVEECIKNRSESDGRRRTV